MTYTAMRFQKDDGGRLAAGFKGSTGDCVTRAIAIVTGLPYQQVYDTLAEGNGTQRITKDRRAAGKRTASLGISVKRKWFKDYMKALGFKWIPTMQIGSGCKVHLNEKELPAGRLVVAVAKHYTAVIDGVIHDLWNPSESRGCTIYPPEYTLPIPKGARWLSNGNGWAYEPEKCVYGYWIQEAA